MSADRETSEPAVAQIGDVGEPVWRFLAERQPPTPCLVIDLAVVQRHYRALQALLPAAAIFYAVKANPTPEVIATLAALGAGVDLASRGEIERCRRLGIPASRMSFGHTAKKETDIEHARDLGIDLFACDSRAELEKLGRAAPGARVFCRLAVSGRGAQWPLTRKFGCDEETALELLTNARAFGVRPFGVSFHVGSQQTDPCQWAHAIARAARVFRDAARAGVELEMLNVGGGLPGRYRTPVPALETYASAIATAVAHHFGAAAPRLVVEPGRFLVADAGVIASTVVLIARKPHRESRRWIYLDAGRFNGLTESMDERIRYRILTPGCGGPGEPVVLAGPTCDSTDVLYQHEDYQLPLDLAVGGAVLFLSAGAYSASYASVEFNGFTPIETYCV